MYVIREAQEHHRNEELYLYRKSVHLQIKLKQGQQTNLPVEMQFYISVMFLGLPDDIHEEKSSFLQSKKTHYGRTDGPTDRPYYRDARTHLKSQANQICV